MEKNEKVAKPKISFQFKFQFEFSTASLARLIEFMEATENVKNGFSIYKLNKTLNDSNLVVKNLLSMEISTIDKEVNAIINNLNLACDLLEDELKDNPFRLTGWLDAILAGFNYAHKLLQDDMKGGE